MKIVFALTGVILAIASIFVALTSLSIAFLLLTDGDGRSNVSEELVMIVALAISLGLSGSMAGLCAACFTAWRRRSNSELTKLF